jgi:hypothetical protein
MIFFSLLHIYLCMHSSPRDGCLPEGSGGGSEASALQVFDADVAALLKAAPLSPVILAGFQDAALSSVREFISKHGATAPSMSHVQSLLNFPVFSPTAVAADKFRAALEQVKTKHKTAPFASVTGWFILLYNYYLRYLTPPTSQLILLQLILFPCVNPPPPPPPPPECGFWGVGLGGGRRRAGGWG